jgi:hypothetical protein
VAYNAKLTDFARIKARSELPQSEAMPFASRSGLVRDEQKFRSGAVCDRFNFAEIVHRQL